jgi:hypothetical protein
MQPILELLVAPRVFLALLDVLPVLAVQLVPGLLAVEQVLVLAI